MESSNGCQVQATLMPMVHVRDHLQGGSTWKAYEASVEEHEGKLNVAHDPLTQLDVTPWCVSEVVVVVSASAVAVVPR